MHRTRDLLVKQRTQSINMVCGLLAEFGVDIPKRLERALQSGQAAVVRYGEERGDGEQGQLRAAS